MKDDKALIASRNVFKNVLRSQKWRDKLKVRKRADVGVCGECAELDKAFLNIEVWGGTLYI